MEIPEKANQKTVEVGPLLSKSRYVQGLQCHKLLWHVYNAPAEVPPPGADQQFIFDQGQQVGSLARRLYPQGIEINGQNGLLETVERTEQSLLLRRPLFEAAFQVNGAYAKVDILTPVDVDAWDVIEVKSGTGVEDMHLDDLAFQAHVLQGAGIRVNRFFLMHVNNAYVRQGPVDPALLFTNVDVTTEIQQRLHAVQARIDQMLQTIRLPSYPELKIGPHCDAPYNCPLHDHCWRDVPKDSVLTLYRGRAKGFTLLNDGIKTLLDIPDDVELTSNQSVQVLAAITSQAQIDRQAVKDFLARLQYPLHFLDFESIAPAVPLFEETRPYQQIVFQFSLHILRDNTAKPDHYDFLAKGVNDPRPEFMLKLREVMGETGSIIVYNGAFEIGRLRECAQHMPESAVWVESVVGRVADLLEPFRSFIYYHPAQEGSSSMKAVLPALTGQSYDHLKIQNGTAASREFMRVTWGNVSEAERETVRNNLLAYCCLDTSGMISILGALRSAVGQPGLAHSAS